jgi:mono/diheme cytochrome c family protein/ketosteroid isomerase-like protein
MASHFRNVLSWFLALVVLAVIAMAIFLWSGVYNVGADDPHTRPVLAMMDTLRDRSIAVRSRDVAVPNLQDQSLVLKGAGQYAAMCTGCHLAPGMEDSEIRPGLYPQPPDLSKTHVDPKVAFWTIKHGVKMSAMPAWGASHDDPTIWSMVAFLQKLPDLTPAQYKDLVAKAPPDEEMEGGHHHHGDEASEDHGVASSHGGDDHHHAAEPVPGYTAGAEPAAEAAADAFHAALKNGDRQKALALLAPDAVVSDDGKTQDRATYIASHLDSDIASLRSAVVHPQFTGSMPMGKTAMVASRSEIHSMVAGKAATSQSKEILTLRDTGHGWLITRIERSTEHQP